MLADTLLPAHRSLAVEAVVDEVTGMNGDDWTSIVENGLATSPLTLEYRFSAPNEPAATELAEFLVASGYEAAIQPPDTDFDDWSIEGTTPETVSSEPDLAEWVRRMAATGVAHGDCTLDGWAVVLG